MGGDKGVGGSRQTVTKGDKGGGGPKIRIFTVTYFLNGPLPTEPKALAENINSYISIIADSILKEMKYESKSYKEFLQKPLKESFT